MSPLLPWAVTVSTSIAPGSTATPRPQRRGSAPRRDDACHVVDALLMRFASPSARPPPHSPPPQTKRSALACRASAKESSAAMKAEDFKCPLACGLADDAEDKARVEMAKAKCVHPDRPVGKACKDCPRR